MRIGIKKGNDRKISGNVPQHYPADRVYLDGDTSKNVQELVARKKDLTDLNLTGTKNTTGSTIASGYYFYLNGTLVRAKTAIANGATFTLNTNYEVVTAGALNELNSEINKITVGLITSPHTLNFNYTFIHKKAGIVTVTIYLTTTSAVAQYAVIATLGEGYRPYGNIYIQQGKGFNIRSNGEIQLMDSVASGALLALSVSFVAEN